MNGLGLYQSSCPPGQGKLVDSALYSCMPDPSYQPPSPTTITMVDPAQQSWCAPGYFRLYGTLGPCRLDPSYRPPEGAPGYTEFQGNLYKTSELQSMPLAPDMPQAQVSGFGNMNQYLMIGGLILLAVMLLK